MTAPSLAASRFGMALVIGAVLGLVYGFLRPLRPRLTHLCDAIFVAVCFYGWLYLGFGICMGDLRFGYSAGLIAGGFLWELTIGRLLRPVWQVFWHFLAIFLCPFKKIFAFLRIFSKKLFAKYKIWVTMEWSIGRIMRRNNTKGDAAHGKAQVSHRIQEKQPWGKGRHSGHDPDLHHRTGHSARHHRSNQQQY